MNDWQPVLYSQTDESRKIIREGVTFDFNSRGGNINLYADWRFTWDVLTRNDRKTVLEVNVERFWQRPYMAISAAQRGFVFKDVNLKEADTIFDEMLTHMRECPDVLASNGKKVARCSHYQDHVKYKDSEYDEDLLDRVYPTAEETQKMFENNPDVIAVSM